MRKIICVTGICFGSLLIGMSIGITMSKKAHKAK